MGDSHRESPPGTGTALPAQEQGRRSFRPWSMCPAGVRRFKGRLAPVVFRSGARGGGRACGRAMEQGFRLVVPQNARQPTYNISEGSNCAAAELECLKALGVRRSFWRLQIGIKVPGGSSSL
jgi:hypothetical protein